jgi:hypothetical protein
VTFAGSEESPYDLGSLKSPLFLGLIVKKILLCAALIFCLCPAAFSESQITSRLDDPQAVYMEAPAAGVDSSAALQDAIDKAAAGAFRGGIVFVPEGRYTLTRTIYIWPSVRVIGYGATRPVLVLPPNTPGFQKGMGVLVMFTGRSPNMPARFRGPIAFPPPGTVPPNKDIADADEDTFYSALSNIDIEIGDGNPAAVAVRFHVAQHSFLTHMDFHLGSGLAGIYMVGNEAEDLHFYGGRYGILSEQTSPGWQFTLIDSTFEGQREAAVREHMAGLTLIRDSFRNVATAIDIDRGYPDELWVKDSRFENISGPTVVISDEHNPMTEIGLQDDVFANAPALAKLRESGKMIAGKGAMYRVKDFNYGLIVPGEGRTGAIGTKYDAEALGAMPAPLAPAIRALPSSIDWVNVHTLGVKGDGKTDDTAAIQQAIDSHTVLYFPMGRYVVRNTITLKADTVLIGLHPTQTQIMLPDETEGYQGDGAPKAILLAPPGGTNMLSGIGMFAGIIDRRAVSVLWKAGEQSLIDDVRFSSARFNPSAQETNTNRGFGSPNDDTRWDGKYPSLWVADGGGGTFADIWTPDTFAQEGFVVTNTKTPGHVYELSNEHHMRNEIRFDHVENWDINAPQTEEEAYTSPESVSLEIDNSHNLIFANYHAYRVARSRAPFPSAVRIYNSSDIHFRNLRTNAEAGYPICDQNGCSTFLRVSKYPFENSVQDMTHHLEVREREFALLDIPADPSQPTPPNASAVLAPGAAVKKLEDSFFSIACAAVDATGKLYFVDRHNQRIYSWSQAEGIEVVRDNPLDPVNLAFDKSGNLIVMSSAGPEATVYTFKPGTSAEDLTLLEPQSAQPHPHASFIFPVNWWDNGEFRDQLDLDTLEFKTPAELFAADATEPRTREYVSMEGSTVLPASRVFEQGPVSETTSWRFSDDLDTYGFITAEPGQRVYVSSEEEDMTYSGVVKDDGTLTDLIAFAHRGGESVAEDSHGNVYVANGQIFVYSSDGKPIAEIDVPERPLQLIFGGLDHKTLFILAHHALFAAQVR